MYNLSERRPKLAILSAHYLTVDGVILQHFDLHLYNL